MRDNQLLNASPAPASAFFTPPALDLACPNFLMAPINYEKEN